MSELTSVEKLAANTRALRAARNWTCRDVQEQGGPSAATVCRIENGDHNVRLSSLVQLAHAFNLAGVHLLFWELALAEPAPLTREPHT